MAEFFLALPALLMSMVAHEYAHGYAALRQGDDTAYRLGRLTFNPLKHIDPFMTVLLPAMLWFGSGGRMIFGGAKPVPVDPSKYRDYRRGDIIVSSAGIVANLILVVLCTAMSVALGLLGTLMPGVLAPLQRMMFWGIWLNLLFANFNLIPIPPLDGSHVMYHLLPSSIRAGYRDISRYGIIILIGMIFLYPRGLYVMLTPAIIALQLLMRMLQPFMLQPFSLF